MVEVDFVSRWRVQVAQIAGALGAAGAAVSLAGWAYPPLLNVFGIPVMVVVFLFGFSGMVLMLFGENEARPARRHGFWSVPSLPSDPFRFVKFVNIERARAIVGLVVVATGAVASAAVGFNAEGSYSQNPVWTISRCEWSIYTNHGLTNICVSHARWIATGQDFRQAFIGLAAFFLALEALLLLGQTIRLEVRASRSNDSVLAQGE
jgi:hypothetical protein